MKRIIAACIITLLICCGCGKAEDPAEYDLTTKDGIQAYTEAYFKDNAHAKIDKITINDDAGTGSGFILLVNLEYDRDDAPAVIGKQIKADSVAFAVDSQDLTEVNQLCLFWNIPQTGSEAKYQYKRVGNAFAEDDIVNPLAS
ncbi:MAG: hypothetical protein IJI87_07525 [Mogibacterium sp.]|nr:hypothetical protein [Mogibacterium sp.]